MKSKYSTFLKTFLSFAVGFIFLYLIYRNTESKFQDTIDDFLSVPPFWLVITCLAFMVSNLIRALRWNMLLEPLGHQPRLMNSFWAVMVGYFANLGVPRSGEVLRPATLSRYEKIPLDQALGTVVVDRLLDFMSLGVIIIIGFLLEFKALYTKLSSLVSFDSLTGKIWLLGFLILSVTILWWFYRNLTRHSDKQWVQTLKSKVAGFKLGIQSVMRVKNVPLLIFYSLTIWALYVLMTYFCVKGFAPTAHLTFSQSLVAFIFAAFGMLLPTPGSMGGYQFALQTGLTIFSIPLDIGLSLAMIIYFTINIFCNILFGIIALIVLPIYNRPRAKPANVL